jgi:hypothetical protein
MKLRPEDQNGDMLPVLHVSDMLSGSLAIAKLVEDRLNLYSGDWWENPSWGNEILRMLLEGRLTEADAQSLSSYLSGYVRSTSGVKEVQDEKWDLSGGRFSWSCTALTEYGSVSIHSEF